jgi:hypothetical protein
MPEGEIFSHQGGAACNASSKYKPKSSDQAH